MTTSNDERRTATAERTSASDPHSSKVVLVGAILVAYLPLTVLGHGTDIDVANVRRTGELILDGDYAPSRLPGAPLFEAAVAVLDAIGGSVAVNLASVAVAIGLVLALRALLVRVGTRRPELVCLVFAANPYAWIAGTSTADFTWALGFLVMGAERHLAGRHRLAAVAFAAAIGCRLSTALLVGAFLLAVAWDGRQRSTTGLPERRAVVFLGAGTAALVAVLYLPPLLWAGGLGFLDADNPWSGLLIHLGRAGAKNLYLPGLAGALLLLAAIPAVLGTLKHWSTNVIVRFAVVALVVTEALFVLYPWKPSHLLPAWLAVLLLVSQSRRNTRRFLGALLATQVLHALVSVWFLAPDVANYAGGARLDLRAGAGVVVNDIRCRTAETPERLADRPGEASERRFECMLGPFQGTGDNGRDPPEPEPGTPGGEP